MSVTPEQIEATQFSLVKRGGYRTEEVDRFLRAVADEHRGLLHRIREKEGSNDDLDAASAEMATLMREVHAQLGEKRRMAEAELGQIRAEAEREAAAIISSATEQADGIRQQADRVLSDAERHAELLRSDGEQRVREQAAETLRAARSELQDLLRRKHELLHSLSTLRASLAEIEGGLEASALSPDVLDDSIVSQTLIDLRADGTRTAQHALERDVTPEAGVADEPGHPAATHPAATNNASTFFAPPADD
jgi:DivIVA domain-containing protein